MTDSAIYEAAKEAQPQLNLAGTFGVFFLLCLYLHPHHLAHMIYKHRHSTSVVSLQRPAFNQRSVTTAHFWSRHESYVNLNGAVMLTMNYSIVSICILAPITWHLAIAVSKVENLQKLETFNQPALLVISEALLGLWIFHRLLGRGRLNAPPP